MPVSVELKPLSSGSEFHKEKFKQVLHYIIHKTDNLPNVGKKVLYKLLYFTDFNYYELNEEKLTGEVYSKLEYGPGPRHFDLITKELKKNGIIEEKNVQYHGYSQIRFNSLSEPDLSLLSANELKHIDDTLCRYATMNGTQIEALSHVDIPWVAGEMNGDLNYELVFYRSPEMSVREYPDD